MFNDGKSVVVVTLHSKNFGNEHEMSGPTCK